MNISIVQVNKDLIKKAIELRRQGHSYTDIAFHLKISKTSVSNYVKNVRLTEVEKKILDKNLAAKKERAKMKISISVRSKKIFKEKVAYDKAEKDFILFKKEPFFLFGMGLYWSYGLQKANYFQFTHSDPFIIKNMVKWVEKYLGIPKKSLKYKTFSGVSRNSESILITKVEVIRRIIAWQKLVMRYYS